jgi:uncharacterized protein
MDNLIFLDANVLFSAAYRPDAGLRRLWRLPGARLITSVYAAEEARRNLSIAAPRRELEELLGSVEVVTTAASTHRPHFSSHGVVRQDHPVLLAATALGATHTLTADLRHFGPYYGESTGRENSRGSRTDGGRVPLFDSRIVRDPTSYDPLGQPLVRSCQSSYIEALNG